MIYHENELLESLRVSIDQALTEYLLALGFDESDLTDFDYSEFDEAIKNFGVK